MRTSHIQNQYSPKFSAWSKTVYKQPNNISAQNVDYSTTTAFYRKDLDWQSLINFFVDKYRYTDKVNVYSYGCSNGSEPYTFLMQLYSNWPEPVAKKFFPIIAKDCDKEAIEMARNGIIPINDTELNVIKNATNDSVKRFLDYVGHVDFEDEVTLGNSCNMKYNENYAKYIKYSVADIKKDYQNIIPDNSIIFARNFWPYLSQKDIQELAANLGKHLKKSSCLILGSYDIFELWKKGVNLESILGRNRFIRACDYLKHIYIKR